MKIPSLALWCLLGSLTGGLNAQDFSGATEALPLGQPIGSTVGPAFKDLGQGTRQVLVGFRANTGDIVDGLVPLFAGLKADGSLEITPQPGSLIGLKGSLKTFVKPGYVVAGIEGYEGLWYGVHSIKQLKILWRKWQGTDTAESPAFGIGPEKADKGRAFSVKLAPDQVAVGIYGSGDREGLNRFSLLAVRQTTTEPAPLASTTVTRPTQPTVQQPSRPQVNPTVAPDQPTRPDRPPVRPTKPQTTPATTTQTPTPHQPDPATQPVANSVQAPTRPDASTVTTPADRLFSGLPSGQENVPSSNPAWEKDLLQLVNAERRTKDLAALTWNEDLARAARYQAGDMAADGYFDHATFDKGRVKVCGPFERIRQFSLTGNGESIAQGQANAQAVVDLWLNTPADNTTVLASRSSQAGVGYVKGLWVLVLGR